MTEQSIQAGKVVSIDYVLTSPKGDELDRSPEGAPLVYLHGANNIVPGLEDALTDQSVGAHLEVKVPPEKGYGVVTKMKPMRILRSKFPPEAHVEKGARFIMQGPEGRPVAIWITKVQGAEVHVTTQHPLAGVTLCFDVTVKDIRDATDEEMAHGHPHGPGGHHGHDHSDDDHDHDHDDAEASDEG